MSEISQSQEYVEHSTEREPYTGEEVFISEAKDTPRFDELKFIEEWIAKPKIVEDCIDIATKENKDDKPKHEDLCPKNLNNGDWNEEPVIVIVYDDSVDPTRQIFENEYEEWEVENTKHKVKYDDEHLSNEDWFQMLQEKKLIHGLLSGRVIQFEDQFNEQGVTEYKDYDADMNEELFIKHDDIGLTALAEENR